MAEISFFTTGCILSASLDESCRCFAEPYQNFRQLVVGDVGQLRAVKLGNHQLIGRVSTRGAQPKAWRHFGAYRVSSTERPDIEKSQRLLALEELETGNLS